MKIEAGQWWETRSQGRAHIRYVAPEEIAYSVFAILRYSSGVLYSDSFRSNGKYYATGSNSGYDLMTHLPDCTGWDWEPPNPVDPGEGWRLLEVGEVMRAGDEFLNARQAWEPIAITSDGVCYCNPFAKVRRYVKTDVPPDWKLIGGVPGGMLYFKPTEVEI